jgi:hypothetical protein
MGRNFVIALLEYFDQLSFTERVGDRRRLARSTARVIPVESKK